MKRIVFTVIFALGLSLAGCSKESPELSSATNTASTVEKSQEREAFKLNLDLSAALVSDQTRSLGYDANAKIMASTDWTAELFLRKQGDPTVYHSQVTFTATKTSTGYKLSSPQKEYTFYTSASANAPATVPDFSESDNWYISAIVGGGSYDATTQTVSFSSTDQLVGSENEKFVCPYVTKWSKATYEDAQRLRGNLKFEIAGTLIQVNVENELHSVLYNEIFFKSNTISPIGSFSFGDISNSDLEGVRPTWTFASADEYKVELAFPYTAKTQTGRIYVWGMPRSADDVEESLRSTTFEFPFEMKLHKQTAPSDLEATYSSSRIPGVNSSFPIKLIASANPKADNVLTNFAPGYLNVTGDGFVDGTIEDANNPNLYTYVTSSVALQAPYLNREITLNGETLKWKIPNQEEATMLLQPYNGERDFPTSYWTDTDMQDLNKKKDGGITKNNRGVWIGFTGTYFGGNVDLPYRKERVAMNSYRNIYQGAYALSAGTPATETTVIYGIRFANKGGDKVDLTTDPKGQKGKNYMRTAFRYTRYPKNDASKPGNIKVEAVIIGHSEVSLSDIQSDSWWTNEAPKYDRVYSLNLATPGFYNSVASYEGGGPVAQQNELAYPWINGVPDQTQYGEDNLNFDIKNFVLNSHGHITKSKVSTLLYIRDRDN